MPSDYGSADDLSAGEPFNYVIRSLNSGAPRSWNELLCPRVAKEQPMPW